MIIYKTINLINGNYYIGKDQKNNKSYIGSGVALQRAIKKYSKENFQKVILEYCDNPKHLCERETYWINFYDALNDVKSYNIAEGGHGGNTNAYHKVGLRGEKNPMYGIRQTPEQKLRQSIVSKEWHKNEDPIKKAERIAKSTAKQKGRPKNQQTIEKMKNSDYHTGKIEHKPLVEYKLISPDGTTHTIKSKKKLMEFCLDNSISYPVLETKVLKGLKPKSGSLVGWQAYRIKIKYA
jgi:GIY-YIG catalytic domain